MITFFKKDIYIGILALSFCLGLIFPLASVLAVEDDMLASVSGNANNTPVNDNANNTSVSGGDSTRLKNPLGIDSIEEFIIKIIDVLLVFALPIIILYIMYAGFLFVTAKGDSGQISTARSALLWAVVGGVIVLGAQIIIGVIQGTITAFK